MIKKILLVGLIVVLPILVIACEPGPEQIAAQYTDDQVAILGDRIIALENDIADLENTVRELEYSVRYELDRR